MVRKIKDSQIIKAFLSLPVWLVAILLVVIFLRIPSLFYPYSYGDEGIYLTLGQAVRQGLTLYRDIHDNKPPLLYLLAAISGSLFWFQVILMIWNLGTIIVFWKLAQHFFKEKFLPLFSSTILFALLTTLPLWEGNIANAEIFMILPILAGFWLVLSGKKREELRFLGAGTLFSLAVLFKVPAGFDFVALGLFLLFSLSLKSWQVTLKKGVLLLAGFSLPLLLFSLYFIIKGAFLPFLQAGLLQNIGYLSSWKGKSQGMIFNTGFILRVFSLLTLTLFFWLTRKKPDKNLVFLGLWLIFSLFGATLSERPYPHYLIQVLPPVSLLVGFFFNQIRNVERLFILFCLCLFLIAHQHFHFWGYPTIAYYQNFFAWVTRQKTNEEYLQYFNSNLPRNQQIASFLFHHTTAGERVFIWGEDAPCLYALSRRLPPGRYAANYHIKDFNGYQETLEAITSVQPKYIVILDQKDEFPQLGMILAEDYLPFSSLDGANLFFRKTFRVL
jgi:hypothetical protein